MTWGEGVHQQGYAGHHAAPAQPETPSPGRRPGRGRALLRAWVLLGVIVVGFTVAALVIATYYGATFGVQTSLLALACAAIPLLIVIPAFVWIDRFEAEPTRYLVFAFLWGALVAAALAAVFNTSASIVFLSVTDPNAALTATAVFVAPPVEEGLKGLLILLVWQLRRHEFDGLVDGVVYAGVVAAGFAFTENIQYLALAYQSGGDAALAGVFVARCLLTPFAHPLFTVMTGIGIGIASTARRRVVRVVAPVVGLLLAMLLHGLWNLSAAAAGTGLVAVYLLVDVPIFLAFLGFVVWARAREGRLIGRYLSAYADAGWIAPAEVRLLSTMSARRSSRAWAKQRGGRRALKTMRALQDTASELALLRQRMFHTAADERAMTVERDLLDDLAAYRLQLAGLTGPPGGGQVVPEGGPAGPASS